MKLRFIDSEKVTEDVRSFVFEPESPITWQPGQYMHYILPHPDEDERGVERWFTNSAAPYENHIMISTRISQPGSSFKRALQAMAPGDAVQADGPEGSFTIEDTDQNYIFVAGGIGITPFRSILMQARHSGQKLKVRLLYANRTEDIPFKSELDQLAVDNPALSIDYIIDPEQIDEKLLQETIDSVDNPLVYISGPKPMVKAFAKQVIEMGLEKENVKKDDFPGYEAY